MPKSLKTDDRIKPNSEYYHEALDRLHVICCMIDDHLLQHPVSKLDKEVSQPIEKALYLLHEAYQITGNKLFKDK
jgi:hypothetical protein